MGREPRGAGCSREDDAQGVGVLVAREQRAKVKELGGRAGSEPVADVLRRPRPGSSLSHQGVAKLGLESKRVVLRGLDAHQQAVERGDVDADGVVSGLQALHERRPRTGKGVEDAPARPHVPGE